MTPDEVVSHFDKAKRTGAGRWTACCPVHNDTHPSMSIKTVTSKEGEPTLLIRCFVCHAPIDQICSAVGLEVSDLYPEKIKTDYSQKQTRKYFPAADVMSCLGKEAMFLNMAAKDMGEGKKLSEQDRKYLEKAMLRIKSANDYIR